MVLDGTWKSCPAAVGAWLKFIAVPGTARWRPRFVHTSKPSCQCNQSAPNSRRRCGDGTIGNVTRSVEMLGWHAC